jgi:tyrosyl-tRNA synthetase
MAEFEDNRAGRLAQKTLAYEVTSLVHGTQAADSVKRISEALFESADYNSLTSEDFTLLKAELPSVTTAAGSSLVDLLVETSLASSKGEARRFLESNAIYVNGEQIPLSKSTVDADDAIAGHVVLRRGRNSLAILELR